MRAATVVAAARSQVEAGKHPRTMTSSELDMYRNTLVDSLKALLPCNICFEPLKAMAVTTCGHVGHARCLEQAIAAQKRCPMCQTPLKNTKAAPAVHALWL